MNCDLYEQPAIFTEIGKANCLCRLDIESKTGSISKRPLGGTVEPRKYGHEGARGHAKLSVLTGYPY